MQQDSLIAGDALDWLTSTPDFSPADGWVLTYRFISRATAPATKYTATCTTAPDGLQHRLIVASTTTALWTPGAYDWAGSVALAGTEHTVDSGTLVIRPNPRTATAMDNRTHARRTLEAIEAQLEGRATSGVSSYQINGRELKYIPLLELVKLQQLYSSMVRQEVAAARVAAGATDPRRVYVRF